MSRQCKACRRVWWPECKRRVRARVTPKPWWRCLPIGINLVRTNRFRVRLPDQVPGKLCGSPRTDDKNLVDPGMTKSACHSGAACPASWSFRSRVPCFVVIPGPRALLRGHSGAECSASWSFRGRVPCFVVIPGPSALLRGHSGAARRAEPGIGFGTHATPRSASPLPQPFHPVTAIQHALHPRLVVEIPVHGAGDAGFEIHTRLPAELALQLRRVDRVAAVVAGAILHELDQRLALAEIGRAHV